MSDIIFRLPEIYESAVSQYKAILEDEYRPELDMLEDYSGAERKKPEVEGPCQLDIFADVFQKESSDNDTDIPLQGNEQNSIVFGDNILYLKHLLSSGYAEKLDLIYIDPPFFSKTDYTINVKVGDRSRQLTLAKNHAFSDKWSDGMAEYLREMAVRLMLMRDLLSETGSLFVHLDWHSSHYLKIILDQIFGEKNFINEIVWNYKSGGVSNRYFARKHDVILFYARSSSYYFSVQKEKSYNRGLKPYRFKGVKEYCDEVGWYTLVSMKDVWQLDMVGRTSSERTGYATQKPESVIERIITSAAPEGGLCADFFCGSGTFGAVCARMGRGYLLCDNGAPAVFTTHKRLIKDGSPHRLFSCRGASEAGKAENFRAEISVIEIEGASENTGISIDGISYLDYKALGIDEKNLTLLDTVIVHHYSQLIDYWCADLDYDGRTIKPSIWAYKEKGDIDLSVVVPSERIKRLAVKVVDAFGNDFVFVHDRQLSK